MVSPLYSLYSALEDTVLSKFLLRGAQISWKRKNPPQPDHLLTAEHELEGEIAHPTIQNTPVFSLFALPQPLSVPSSGKGRPG